jgi:hypothetical protein
MSTAHAQDQPAFPPGTAVANGSAGVTAQELRSECSPNSLACDAYVAGAADDIVETIVAFQTQMPSLHLSAPFYAPTDAFRKGPRARQTREQ